MVTTSKKKSKKAGKKASKKTASKTAKRTAQIQLDPAIVHQFESHLREGLVASGAVLMSAENPKLKAGAKVELDSDTIAQLAEILRNGLVSSGAVLATEFPQMDKSARKSPAKGKRKGYGSSTSKKR
jgi:hypothetical protein